jgi:hypothetical protein
MSDPSPWPLLFVAIAAVVVIIYALLTTRGSATAYVVTPRRPWQEDAEEQLREVAQRQRARITELEREIRELKRASEARRKALHDDE